MAHRSVSMKSRTALGILISQNGLLFFSPLSYVLHAVSEQYIVDVFPEIDCKLEGKLLLDIEINF